MKAEIVRSVVNSLTNKGSSESSSSRSKRRKVSELDNFNMDLFNNLSVRNSAEESKPENDSGSDSDSF